MATKDDLQPDDHSCGPSALKIALYALGHILTLSAIRRWAGTTEDGTSPKGIIKAANHYGHKAKKFQTSSPEKAWKWLRMSLNKGRPVIICCYNWRHWVCATATFGNKVHIMDSDSTCKQRRYYSGLEIHSKEEWLPRWASPDEKTGEPVYYAISIHP